MVQNTPRETFLWGDKYGNEVTSQIQEAYERVVHMRRNIFMPPTGNSTKELIREISKLLNEYNEDTAMAYIAMKALMILPALVLQKPSAKSKSQDHVAALKRRMKLWKDGEIMSLLSEAQVIQKRMKSGQFRQSHCDIAAKFSKLMGEGKINQATRLLTSLQKSGILELTDENMELIKLKHPKGK